MVIKNPYDFGRRCIKYFCNFLFIYTTLTDIFIIIMRAVTAFIIIHTTNSDSCAHCFVTCTIENKYLKKRNWKQKQLKQ